MFSHLRFENWLAIIGIAVAVAGVIVAVLSYRRSRRGEPEDASIVEQKTKGKPSPVIHNRGDGDVNVSYGGKDD